MLRKMHFLAWFLLALRIFQTFSQDNNAAPVAKLTLMEKYEYCVKLITVCHSVWDTPSDYEDIDSNEVVKQDIEKSKCVPKNLSDHGMKLYWSTVEKWQDDVKLVLASGDGFTIQEQFNNGRSLRVQLWNVFKIRKTVVCNRDTNDETTSEPEKKECDNETEIGIWINEQIERKQSMISLIDDRLPITLQRLVLQIHHKCCPYAILKDRFEIINDYMDSIMQLQTIELYERIKPTGHALVDINNLMTRLQYLDRKTINGLPFGSNCCNNNWPEQVKDVNNNFRAKAARMLVSSSPADSFKPLLDSQNKLKEHIDDQFDRLHRAEKLLEKALLTKTEKLTNCCTKLNASINDIESNIISYKSYNFKHQSNSDMLYNNIKSTRDNIEHTQSLLVSEQKEIDQLENMWTTEQSQHSSRSKSYIDQKLSYVGQQVQQISDSLMPKNALVVQKNLTDFNKTLKDKSNSLKVIEDQLERFLAQPPVRRQKPIARNLTTAELKNDRVVKHCMDMIDQQTEDLRKLQTALNENKNAHLSEELKAGSELKKLYDYLDILEKDVQSKLTTDSKTEIDRQTDNLKSSENQIQGISKNTEVNNLAANKQSQNIINFEDQLTDNLNKKGKKINLSNSKIKESLDSQINQKESYSKPKNLNQAEISRLYNEINAKIDNVNKILSQIKDKHMKGQKMMLETIDKLETKLNLVFDKTNKAEAAAIKCSDDCDLGELPSIEELINRLKLLERELKKT